MGGGLSKRVTQIADRKPAQFGIVIVGQRDNLEPFAHFSRQCEQHRLSRQVQALHEIDFVDVRDEFRDAVADQEMGLRRVTGEPRPARSAATATRGEIDPRADVVQPGVQERILVIAMTEMAQQRALRAARCDNTRAAADRSRSGARRLAQRIASTLRSRPAGRGSSPTCSRAAALRRVRARCAHGRSQRASAARSRTSRGDRAARYTERVDLAVAHDETLDRHRIEHLVGDHHAAQAVGQRSSQTTRDARRRYALRERRTLPLAQVGAHFENVIAARQRVEPLELAEQRAASAPEPAPTRAVAAAETRAALRRTACARQRPNTGEISGAVMKSPPRRACARPRCSSQAPARTSAICM